MSNTEDTRATFEALHDRDRDPWDVETSEYERLKRAATLADLPADRFARILDIGCSTGMLTAKLAGVAGNIVAVDIAENALQAARARMAG